MTARTTARPLVAPAFAYARTPDDVAPLARVNDVALGLVTVVPELFINEIVPEHDAAVPLVEFDATFATLIATDSELARLTTGSRIVRVALGAVVVSAAAVVTTAAASETRAKLLNIDSPLPLRI